MKLLLYLFSFAFVSFYKSFAADTIEPYQTLLDNDQTLISIAEEFELGFFSPSNSTNRYIGIWSKKVSQPTVVWVANRDNPLSDSSGVFTISQTGNVLIFSNKSGITYWSSNSSSNGPPILRLLDTGNLVVKDGDGDDNGNENYNWQSFEHPGDTLIAGMKQGWNLKTGQHWYLTSWKSPQDPSTGSYRYQIDPRGLPQLVQYKDSEVVYRTGPWDGVRFGGDPPLKNENPIFKPTFVFNTTHVYYTFENEDHASFSRFWVNPSGSLQHLRWNENRKEWTTVFTLQKDECDTFGRCGPNGVCDINKNPVCQCPIGFVPKAPQDWIRLDTSGGCVPKIKLSCGMDVGFKKFHRMKLPYGTEFLVNRMVTKQDECEAACLRNCSCTAYAMARISGCVLWFKDLLDIRAYNEFGQDLYIRMAASEVEVKGLDILLSLCWEADNSSSSAMVGYNYSLNVLMSLVAIESNNKGKRTALIISLSVLSVFLILVMVSGCIIRKRTYSNKSQGIV
ncbi:hypothetical protein FEM48_Zijuj01G0138500 [Ziziphus jujuba var. spinosa]|uniref:non-specific serine/threonine protein kinase n=1 Tax=Ziziphus jujuba var. spinosa TaxID=714518 RepID=A0A978W1M7_ZIZJJ|nr:hypothetical protein FEM48_Zijuj01G0138500 [Ziziphus jujuba var. spinosa]